MNKPNQVHLLPLYRRETIKVSAEADSRPELQDVLRTRAERYFGAKVELQRLVVNEETYRQANQDGGIDETIRYRGDAWYQQRDGRQETPEDAQR